MKRIMFVDDEPNVLQGLRRMLRSQRDDWEMAFAQSGPEALTMMEREPYDVVVSDMRMPGMNGVELLAEVMRRHPETVRIVLSGHVDKELIMRSVGSTHQYLAKPCDAQMLKSTIVRACALRELLHSDSLKALVSGMPTLPSLPALYLKIVAELRSPDASIEKAGQIIAQDIGMSAHVLHLVNSSFFGLCHHVSNPTQAVTLLGLNTIRALVLSVHLFSCFDKIESVGLSLNDVWSHSIATGALAKRIAKDQGAVDRYIDYALMAGLMHDVGKLVLTRDMLDQYRETVNFAREQKVCLWRVERDRLGATHAELGAYLLGLWGLPDPIVEAVALHHTPQTCAGPGLSVLTAVHVADVLEHESQSRDSQPGAGLLDLAYLETIGQIDRIDSWRQMSREVAAKGGNGD